MDPARGRPKTEEEKMRAQRRQEEAAFWVSDNVTMGMLPSEMIANEGGDPSSNFMNDEDFNRDMLSVSSQSDSEIDNTRRLGELLSRPKQERNQPEAALRSNLPSRGRPLPHQQYQNPNCSQTAFYGTPRRYVINSNGVGPNRYVINNHELGGNHYKLKLPGFSEDLDVKIGARPHFANDASQVVEKIDSMLRKQHENLERHVMEVFDRELNRI